jgi:RHS repeat-associated protein
VVTELQGGDKVSKHYYMNTQRVATDISINYQGPVPMAGPQQPNARDPKMPSEDTASVNYNAAFADLQATLNALGHRKLDVNELGQQPTLEEYYPELVRETAFSTTAAKNAPESTTRVLFWYHPDYLGNVDLVTERDGNTYEFFTYNPWGEEMHQYNANTFSFSSPYRFNSKEKDAETGLHYYGARYYHSRLSVWMSVDPLVHVTLEPYIFSGNNPVMFVDPDGRQIDPSVAQEWSDNKSQIQSKVNELRTQGVELISQLSTARPDQVGSIMDQIGELDSRINTLKGTLSDMSKMESNKKTTYTLSGNTMNGAGVTYYNTSKKMVEIVYSSGDIANFVHEVTHGSQFENGELFFMPTISNPHASIGSIDGEIQAYQAELAYSGSCVGSNSLACSNNAITPSFVLSLEDNSGNKIYLGQKQFNMHYDITLGEILPVFGKTPDPGSENMLVRNAQGVISNNPR